MISPALAGALAARRADFNRRTHEAHRRYQQAFDEAAFTAFLVVEVDGVVQAAARLAEDRVHAVASAAYDIALELNGLSGAAGAGGAAFVSQVWRELAPALARLVALHPEQVLGMLSNAALHLTSLAGARSAQWLDEMIALAPRIETPAELRAVGQVLAWRAGAAHFRVGALAAADGLPESLALAAFPGYGEQDWRALRSRLQADPWHRPGHEGGCEIGGFTGLGGTFATPPQVRAGVDCFVVESGERHFLLLADAYGAMLLTATPEEFAAADQDAQQPGVEVASNMLLVGRQAIAIDLPAAGLKACATAATIAITSPYTHAIRLVPREAGHA
ncbi:hypothetical protein ACSUZJ_12010 [Telluria sp. B2]